MLSSQDDLSMLVISIVYRTNPTKAEYVIENGADVNQLYKNMSLLHHAIKKSNAEIVALLINAGAEYEKLTALNYAMEEYNLRVIDVLISFWGDVNEPYMGEYPLVYAINKGDSSLVKILKQYGARFDKVHKSITIDLNNTKISKAYMEAIGENVSNYYENIYATHMIINESIAIKNPESNNDLILENNSTAINSTDRVKNHIIEKIFKETALDLSYLNAYEEDTWLDEIQDYAYQYPYNTALLAIESLSYAILTAGTLSTMYLVWRRYPEEERIQREGCVKKLVTGLNHLIKSKKTIGKLIKDSNEFLQTNSNKFPGPTRKILEISLDNYKHIVDIKVSDINFQNIINNANSKALISIKNDLSEMSNSLVKTQEFTLIENACSNVVFEYLLTITTPTIIGISGLAITTAFSYFASCEADQFFQ